MDRSYIRNFSIIAHINHGKSTLADRLLELTKTVPVSKMRPQMLDQMALEQERGITIKMQPVRMEWKGHEINLIDTPGHVDFSYEVSRALAAVEGAVLLVDAQKGVQAQTLSHLHLAQQQGIVIIPAVNKVDLPQARVQEVKQQLVSLLGVNAESIFEISAKTGHGVEELLRAVITAVPPPQAADGEDRLRALVFDSVFDAYKGVIAYVRLVNGSIKSGERILLMAAQARGEALEVGTFRPELKSERVLSAGEIGYVATGVKNSNVVNVGDTLTHVHAPAHKALPGYREPKPMVFASLYPEDADDFDGLKVALGKLKLNDAALVFEPESSEALGRGFRSGFLGLLHLEIVVERLLREHNMNLIVTPPSVVYRLTFQNGEEELIYSALQFEDPSKIRSVAEPWVALEVITPVQYMGAVMKLLEGARAVFKDTKFLSEEQVTVVAEAPLAEVITDFFDTLKSITAGFASMSYELLDFREGKLVRLDVLVAGEMVEQFSRIVPEERSYEEGRRLVSRLKELLPKQLFAVALQAAIGGKIIARETIPAMRKDVTGYLYGGDVTRKRKLLEKQKKGKKKMKEIGRVRIPANVFQALLKREVSGK